MKNLQNKYKSLDNHKLKALHGINVEKIFLSNNSNNTFEVVYCTSINKPQTSNLRSIWKERRQGTAIPLVVACEYEQRFSICGPVGNEPPVYENLNINIAQIICSEALDKENYPLALRSIKENLFSLNSVKIGIQNEGLFSDNVIEKLSKTQKNWKQIVNESKKLMGKSEEILLKSLGYEIENFDKLSFLLRVSGKKKALAVLLKSNESIDIENQRFGNLSPIANTFAKADREGVQFVIVCTPNSIRLYPANLGVGVGSKGRTETFIHFNLKLLEEDDFATLKLICSAESILEKGYFFELLDDSKRFSGNLVLTIRESIHSEVIPLISKGIKKELFNKKKLGKSDLDQIYNLSLLILFRIIFIAYSEDKDLLPYKSNDLYKKRSLKNIAQELMEALKNKKLEFEESNIYWDNLNHLFNAVNYGNKTWNVPPYNGGLFSNDENSPFYYKNIDDLKITDKYLAPALIKLLVDKESGGPVDFRSLGVKEFGNIYEGLIDSSLYLAEENLNIDKKGILKPVKTLKDKKFDIEKDNFYLTNNSGFRKSSGSHFTKVFIVEFLLENSINSSLEEHFKNLDTLSEEQASENFFDYKIADIAMGSGHFLVSAVDFIEIKFSQYLSKRKLNKVIEEISSLKILSESNLNKQPGENNIDDSQILRRLIARKCIYGIDINPISVQLARLAIWIHTFVPGLPLSFLDHNLVYGNSLVGIGTFEEVKQKIISDQKQTPLFFDDPAQFLEKSIEPVKKLSKLRDATLEEVKFAKKAKKEIEESTQTLKAFFDLICVLRINNEPLDLIPLDLNFQQLEKDLNKIITSKIYKDKEKQIKSLKPFHFPVAFPEVYLRDNPGFNLIVGNPPWEEVTVEEDAFWARHFPGLHAFTSEDKRKEINKLKNKHEILNKTYSKEIDYTKNLRKVLLSGEYKGMGKGDPDLYKGFCWRFLKLVNNTNGIISVVLPRDAFNSQGSTDFRQSLFYSCKNIKVSFLLNNQHWVFEDVHAQYTIALLSAQKKIKDSDKTQIYLPKVIRSFNEFKKIKKEKIYNFSLDDIKILNGDYSLPTLSSNETLNICYKMGKFPKISNEKIWKVFPHSELHATNDREFFNFDLIKKDEKFDKNKYWPVYKGDSIHYWNPDTATYFAHGDSKLLIEELYARRLRASKNKNSVFSKLDKEFIRSKKTLSCLNHRIVFRNVTNRTNTRTFISAIIPKNIFAPNFVPYLIHPNISESEMVYLVGIFNSIPFDWYARLWVEINVNFFIFDKFPVPKLEKNNNLFKEIVKTAGKLSCVDKRYEDLARKIGIKISKINENEKNDLICYLDALVSKSYNLSAKDIELIFKTFHHGWNYSSRLNKVMKYYQNIK